MEQDRYALRGVSSQKEEVHKAIKNMDKGLFPNAFCKILPDLIAGDPAFCNVMHADTAGTKTSLAYIYWKETGDLSVWEGIAQDALVKNLILSFKGTRLSSASCKTRSLNDNQLRSRLINFGFSFFCFFPAITLHAVHHKYIQD